MTNGLPHLRMNNIDVDGSLNLEIIRRVPSSLPKKHHYVQKGDILFCSTNSGKLVGKSAIFGIEGIYSFSNHLVKLTPDFRLVNPVFLQKYLWLLWKKGSFEKYCKHWVNQSSLPKEKLVSTPILLPPIREQHRIVAKLERLLEKVDKCKERLSKIPLILKRFRQAIIAAACSGALTMDWRKENSDLISEVNLLSGNKTKTKRKEFDQPEYFIGIWQDHKIPETWKWVLLSDVAEARLGKMLDKKKNSGHPTKYLRNVNVRWFSFELSDLLEIKASKEELQKLSLEKGDALVCEGGEPGRAAVWNDDIKGIIYQKAIHRIRLKGDILPQWLVLNLKNDSNNKKIENLFTGTTIKHLTGQSIAKYPFSVPPLKEQKEIVRRVESFFALADRIEARYQNAQTHVDHLAQSILAKAFRGELVPQDPGDPPASELFQQIQAEREKQQPGPRKAGKRGPAHQRRARPKG